MDEQKEKICCPEFDSKPWNEKTLKWQDKQFITDNVAQFLHMPLNMGQVITRMWQKAQKASAECKDKDFVLMAYDPSPWKSELYMSVAKEVPDAKNVKISGTFMTRVYDGPYQDVPKWFEQQAEWLKKQGKTATKNYCYYAYCPKCSKKYGHNYVVVISQV